MTGLSVSENTHYKLYQQLRKMLPDIMTRVASLGDNGLGELKYKVRTYLLFCAWP